MYDKNKHRFLSLCLIIAIVLPVSTARTADDPFFTGTQTIHKVSLIDRQATVGVTPGYRVTERNGITVIDVLLEFALGEFRRKLESDLNRKWTVADCTGDDFETRDVKITERNRRLYMRVNIHFTRWWSVTDCAIDRNHQITAEGPVEVEVSLKNLGDLVRLETTVSKFDAIIEVFGIPVDVAKDIAKNILENHLSDAVTKFNDAIAIPEDISKMNPNIKDIGFLTDEKGFLGAKLAFDVTATPDVLNKIMALILGA